MMILFQKNIFILLVIFSATVFAQNNDAINVVKSVADRIIEDCQFEFELVKQQPVLGVQIIDFNKEYRDCESGFFYALSYIQSKSDTSAKLGISASENISVWLNDQLIDFKKTNSSGIKEIAYGMIIFHDTVSIKINKGENKFLIKSEINSRQSKIFLRQITDNPEAEGGLKFYVSLPLVKQGASGWLTAGPFSNQSEDLPEKEIKDFYFHKGKIVSWTLPKENILAQLKIGENNIFKKDSYADWNYANGETILSILTLAEASGEKKYYEFVKQWCDFAIDNSSYFKYQYDSLYALRGSYHRIFRKSMLDDAGAPVLPLVHLYLKEKNEKYFDLINEMAQYVSSGQMRLTDGTLCRPEPVEMTVWADDLFMAVPFFLRIGKITGDKKYYDDAINQIKNFTNLLYNKEKNLYKHGWFSKTNKTSVAFWGRANGWVMWALSEALLLLPADHKSYSDVMTIYKNHIDGLVKHQDKSGMWHQVLDYPESYEESSCTAMFILGIARGVNNGWLDESYSVYALNGWKALIKKIEPGGIVHGICRGTGIGNDLEFYFNRQTFDNDPRGLGAVLTAGIEIWKLQSKR